MIDPGNGLNELLQVYRQKLEKQKQIYVRGFLALRTFKRIYIEITNVCNLRCEFCPQTARKPEFMAIEDFSRILDQLKGCTRYLFFHVKGEPLLHPKIGEFLNISHEKGFDVNITTNGTLIERTRDVLLANPALRQINFSLHSFDGHGEDHGKDTYIENILSFINEAMSHTEMLIAMRLWNLEESRTYSERRRNHELLAAIEREFALPYRIEEKVLSERGIKIADRVYVNQDYQFRWPNLRDDEGSGNGFCYGLRSQAAILVDGTVVPCCLDGEGVINLGNILTTPFSEIINGERARLMIDGFTRRTAVEALCRRCDFRKRFDINAADEAALSTAKDS